MASTEDDSLTPALVQDSAKEETNLISLVCKEGVSVVDVENYFKQVDGNVDINHKNEYGNTALMIACYNGKKTLVEFLLQKGADPNLTNETGETALHKACDYTPYDGEEDANQEDTNEQSENKATKDGHGEKPSQSDNRSKDTTQSKIRHFDQKSMKMVELLLEYNASFQLNDDGLHPVDLAALQGKEGTVAYFIVNKLLSNVGEIKAMESLALALALDNKCRNAYLVLVKAMKKRHAGPNNPISKNFTSELEGFLGHKESQTLEELKSLKTSKHSITVEAVLTGDRILPQSLKAYHLYERLEHYGVTLLYHAKTMEEGFRILTGCLQLEQRSWLYLNQVLMSLRCSLDRAATKKDMLHIMPQFLSGVCKILKAYVGVMQEVSCTTLEECVEDIVTNLSLILFDVAYKYEGMKVTDDFIVPITEMINVIWSRIPKPEATGSGIVYPTLSVCHYVLLHMVREFCTNYLFGDSNYTCYQFKRLIARLLHVEGALDVDCRGNTMMHTLMILVQSSELHMVVDLAKLFIRHGCPTNTKNKKGETPEFIARDEAANSLTDPQDSRMDEVYRLLKGPTDVYPLQELAARAILYHRISYDKLPAPLQKVINDPILEDDAVVCETSSDSDPASDFDSDSDSDSSMCVIA